MEAVGRKAGRLATPAGAVVVPCRPGLTVLFEAPDIDGREGRDADGGGGGPIDVDLAPIDGRPLDVADGREGPLIEERGVDAPESCFVGDCDFVGDCGC